MDIIYFIAIIATIYFFVNFITILFMLFCSIDYLTILIDNQYNTQGVCVYVRN